MTSFVCKRGINILSATELFSPDLTLCNNVSFVFSSFPLGVNRGLIVIADSSAVTD